ncbi:hypothetical protein [Haloarchaeobius amylolyticus]|uniref:hypothetical protein n=1 Tax=Haloarchaeobius amylolyticus TaxID=1198296 RepID=UPI00226D6D5C|nr:hypothetical protein [Haloarchaeobius amylolyticus]
MNDSVTKRWVGFLLGMSLTSASLSSGFIWACGSACIDDPFLWTGARQPLMVFGAALAAWWGYLLAHYAITGGFIDDSGYGSDTLTASSDASTGDEQSARQWLGVLFGAGVLVAGMVVGVVYIRQGNHLLTNVGGVLFLGGYAIAHYMETGDPL